MEKVNLWDSPAEIPLFNAAYGAFEPCMELYPLPGGHNPCVLVIPGGGYGCVCKDHEGEQIARYLNANGYAAAVLDYRVAPYAYPAMVLDAQRAIRTLRHRAAAWGLAPDKIGTIGFSAGGHLCCMTALLYDDGKEEGDAIDRVSCRINTAAPCYAVSSFDAAITHMGTCENFFGGRCDPQAAFGFSAENMIRDDTPPVFLWHTAQDGAVNPACSLRFAAALIARGIPCELHVFPYGQHGLGLAKGVPLAEQWPALYVRWLDYYNK